VNEYGQPMAYPHYLAYYLMLERIQSERLSGKKKGGMTLEGARRIEPKVTGSARMVSGTLWT
jgi:hypothetical protein